MIKKFLYVLMIRNCPFIHGVGEGLRRAAKGSTTPPSPSMAEGKPDCGPHCGGDGAKGRLCVAAEICRRGRSVSYSGSNPIALLKDFTIDLNGACFKLCPCRQ